MSLQLYSYSKKGNFQLIRFSGTKQDCINFIEEINRSSFIYFERDPELVNVREGKDEYTCLITIAHTYIQAELDNFNELKNELIKWKGIVSRFKSQREKLDEPDLELNEKIRLSEKTLQIIEKQFYK